MREGTEPTRFRFLITSNIQTLMIDYLIQRCERICGKGSGRCFVANRKQVNCITDMVINKVVGVQGIIDHARALPPGEDPWKHLEMVGDTLQALLDWVRYIQVIQDLRELRTYAGQIQGTTRDERYPLPEPYRDYVRMEIESPHGPIRVRLIEFSRHGIRFRGPVAFEPGSLKACSLSTSRAIVKQLAFELRIKHCHEELEGYVAGGRVEEVSDQKAFRVFQTLYRFIMESAGGFLPDEDSDPESPSPEDDQRP